MNLAKAVVHRDDKSGDSTFYLMNKNRKNFIIFNK